MTMMTKQKEWKTQEAKEEDDSSTAIVDGVVPLCLRRKLRDSKESSSSVRKRYEEKESRSITQSKMKNCVMNNTASGSKDICPRSTEEKDKHSKNREVTFIII